MTASSPPLHVVVATDENFAMPTAVTLRSLLVNGDERAHITVLHDGLSLDAIDGILASLPSGSAEPRWVDVSDFDVRPTTASHPSNGCTFPTASAPLPRDSSPPRSVLRRPTAGDDPLAS